MQTQNSLLGFRINLYFDDYKLAIVIDELGFKFIIIDPGKKVFGTFKIINEIFKHIKQLPYY